MSRRRRRYRVIVAIDVVAYVAGQFRFCHQVVQS